MGQVSEHEVEPTSSPVDGAVGTEAPPKKRRRKAPLVIGILAAIVVVAGAGFWVWHETPSFCGTMCHDTMGSYLDSYENSDYLVADHAAQNIACLDCHEAELATQIAELQVQLSGDYRIPLAKMETEDEFCLRDGCHTRDEIVAALSDYTTADGTSVNPHEQTIDPQAKGRTNPHGAGESIACATCHTAHRPSAEIQYCYDACHHTETFEACSDCHND